MNNTGLKSLQNQNHTSNNTVKLEAFAAPLVHDTVFNICMEIIKDHNKGKALDVLILGAGSGYFDKRLMDYGIKNIDAIEYLPEYYKAKGTRLYSYDLNNTWANKLLTQNNNRKYDLIIAIEVIEHLENSFMLMREIKAMLGYNGNVILTSPNVESMFSRFRFFLTGYMEYFGESEMRGTGHINPILLHVLKLNIEINRIKLIHIYNNRNVWLARIKESTKFKKIFIIVISMISFVCLSFKRKNIFKNKMEGEINIYHLRNLN